jgi:hypothetical protein
LAKNPPFETETWIREGLPSRQLYDFMANVAVNNNLTNEGIGQLKRFDDLAGIEAVIKNPRDGFTVMVNSQGLATYKASISTWVKSADDSTVIT